MKNLNQRASSRSSLTFISLILIFICLSALTVGTGALASDSVKVNVERTVTVEVGGAVVITDTLKFSPDTGVNINPISDFIVGLPSKYQGNLFYVSAYDDIGALNVTRGVDLDGFYGIDTKFRDAIDLTETGSYEFVVLYVLSGLIVSDGGEFNLSLPLHPVLDRRAEFYNLTVALPPRTMYVNSSSYFDNATVTTPQYSYQILNRSESDLEPFTNQTSWITFKHSGEPKEFLLIELSQMVREIRLDPWGDLLVSDFYQLINIGDRLPKIPFYLPRNATGISAQDVYGSVGVRVEDEEDADKRVSISLREALTKDEKIKITLNYRLPFKMHVDQDSFEDYTLTLDFLNFIHYIARSFTVEVVLPEGAEFQASKKNTGDTFQGEITFVNVTRFHDLNFSLRYRYNIFSASFGPVSWVGVSTAIFSAVLFLKGAAKPAVIVVPIPPKTLRKFVDNYEEKMRIELELRSMERRVRRGKLSRRRYRLRRSSLNNRLSMLQKESTGLRSEIESAGGRYVDMMRQLEVAEAELQTLRGDIQSVEARFRRKELSAEARRRLLDEYSRRRDRAESTISRAILTLREELH